MTISRRTSRVDRSMFETSVRGLSDPLDPPSQLIDNAFDWEGTLIWLFVHAGVLEVLDNGVGMGDPNQDAFVALGSSTARGMRDMKGRNGTGADAYIHFADRLEVETSTDGKTLVSFGYTKAEHEAALFDGAEIEFKTQPKPADHRIEHTGTLVRWYLNEDGRNELTAEFLRDNLALKLAPFAADKVFVNGELLKPRELVGKPVHLKLEHPTFGPLHVHLSVVAKPQYNSDMVAVGARGPVMELRSFLKEIRNLRAFRHLMPQVLLDPCVIGVVDFPAFFQFATNDRRSFTHELYRTRSPELVAFLSMLRSEVEPPVRALLEETRKEQDASAFTEALHEVVAGIQARLPVDLTAGDTSGGRPEGSLSLALTVGSPLEVACGESVEIGVRGKHDVVWIPVNAGGTFSDPTARSGIYTAGDQPGHYTLVVRTTDGKRERKLRLHLVEERHFGLNIRKIRLPPGEAVTLRTRNVDQTSGNLVWAEDPRGLGELIDDDEQALFTAGVSEGMVCVTVFDREAPQLIAQCEVTIDREAAWAGRDRQLPPNMIHWEGQTFHLEAQLLPDAEWVSMVTGGTIYFNFGHPMFDKRVLRRSSTALRLLIWQELALRVAEVLSQSTYGELEAMRLKFLSEALLG